MRLCINDGHLEDMELAFEEDPYAAEKSDSSGRSALSDYAKYGSKVEVLEWLLDIYPNAAMATNRSDSTPLHYLYKNRFVTLDMVKCVLDANPHAAKERDNDNCYPVHHLCDNPKISGEMLSYVLSESNEDAAVEKIGKKKRCLTLSETFFRGG